jgi:hypothetical protein
MRYNEKIQLHHEDAVFSEVTLCAFCKNIPEDGILHSHRRENLKSYHHTIALLNMIILVATIHKCG